VGWVLLFTNKYYVSNKNKHEINEVCEKRRMYFDILGAYEKLRNFRKYIEKIQVLLKSDKCHVNTFSHLYQNPAELFLN
jgi:hypothetical protein